MTTSDGYPTIDDIEGETKHIDAVGQIDTYQFVGHVDNAPALFMDASLHID